MVCFIASLQLPYTVNFSTSDSTEAAKFSTTLPSANPRPAVLPSSNLPRLPERKKAPEVRDIIVTPPTTPPQKAQTPSAGPDEQFFQLEALDSLQEDVKRKLLEPSKAPVPSQQRVLLSRAASMQVVPQIPQIDEQAVSDTASSNGGSPVLRPQVARPATPTSPDQKSRTLSTSSTSSRGTTQHCWRRKLSGTEGSRISGRRPSSAPKGFVTGPWKIETTDQGNGGLRNAISAALDSNVLQDRVWVGTLGVPTDNVDKATKSAIAKSLADNYDSIVVYTKDKVLNAHYTKYCKEILWPVFHNQIPDDPDDSSYPEYVEVNEAVANSIIEAYQEGDVVWIHDYHLMLVPSMIRERIPDAKIGFFLHSAFPSSEVFRCLAARTALLEGLLGSTMIGFQTEEYARHFLQTCSRLLCVEASHTGIYLEERFVGVHSISIGIDPKYLSEKRAEPVVHEIAKKIRERYGDKKLIVARDKFDHIRGVKEKLLSFELFLNDYPEWADKAVLIQVALSTTDDPILRDDVTEIITRINSRHASLDHSPIVFLHQDIPFSQYLALLTIADCLMVTSLREGMNLTSHEFIECQEKKHSPLLLSEFTGSADILNGSFWINPWDHRHTADSLKTALELSEAEKESRWSQLHRAVHTHTGASWVRTYLATLDKVYEDEVRRAQAPLSRLNPNEVKKLYQESKKRLIFLDFEGTLASWGSPTDTILTNPQKIIGIVNDLVYDKGTSVYVMSGRRPEELERFFSRLPGAGYIAEHGAYIRHGEKEPWINNVEGKLAWKKSINDILEFYVERTPGTYIERRLSSLIFHYRSAEDLIAAGRQAAECANHINDQFENQNVHAVPVEGAVIVEPTDTNKATAAQQAWDHVVEQAKINGDEVTEPDFLLVIGNDRDDEVIYRWANEKSDEVKHVTTANVGTRNTEAKYSLTIGVAGVRTTLLALSS